MEKAMLYENRLAIVALLLPQELSQLFHFILQQATIIASYRDGPGNNYNY
jgi:hypothetical protein